MVQHLREELLVIQLAESLQQGEIIMLTISDFQNLRFYEGVVMQNPHRWESKR